jgi:hypothetical protein
MIQFLEDSEPGTRSRSCFGEIRIGGFSERFETSLFYWDKTTYRAQWRGAARQLLVGDRAGFITSFTEPTTANFIRWWVAYRSDESIFFQEQMLFMDQLVAPFDVSKPEGSVRDRQTVTEDGHRISEWTTTTSAIRTFLETPH